MSDYYFPTSHFFRIRDMSSDVLDAWTDAVLDELHEIDGVIEPDLGGSLAAGRIEFTFAVAAESHNEVYDIATRLMREALDAVDITGAEWTAIDITESSVTVAEAEPAYA